MTFTEQFLAETAEILKHIDVAAVERLAATLAACRAGGGRSGLCAGIRHGAPPKNLQARVARRA